MSFHANPEISQYEILVKKECCSVSQLTETDEVLVNRRAAGNIKGLRGAETKKNSNLAKKKIDQLRLFMSAISKNGPVNSKDSAEQRHMVKMLPTIYKIHLH